MQDSLCVKNGTTGASFLHSFYRCRNADFVEHATTIRVVKTKLIGASRLNPVRCRNAFASCCKQRLFFSINGDVDPAGARIWSAPPNCRCADLLTDRYRIWKGAELEYRIAFQKADGALIMIWISRR